MFENLYNQELKLIKTIFKRKGKKKITSINEFNLFTKNQLNVHGKSTL